MGEPSAPGFDAIYPLKSVGEMGMDRVGLQPHAVHHPVGDTLEGGESGLVETQHIGGIGEVAEAIANGRYVTVILQEGCDGYIIYCDGYIIYIE